MTSAMTTAAAYESWLGIPAAQHPPHHYALLGLPPFAASEQAVLQAYQQRSMYIGQHLGGPHADAARRLLSELAAAQACLLNAQAKSAYDHWLASRLQGAQNQTSAGASRPAPRSKYEPPIAAPPAATELPSASYATYAASEEPSSALPWIVGGVCAGLLAVAVLGVALFGMQQDSPAEVAAHSATATSSPKQTKKPARGEAEKNIDRRKTKLKRDADDMTLRIDDVLGERVAPLTTTPEPLELDTGLIGPPVTSGSGDAVAVIDARDDDPPMKTKTDDGAAKPAEPTAPATTGSATALASAAAKLPRAFALPSRTTSGAQGLLAKLPVKDADKVQLALDATGVAGGDQYQLLDEAAGFSAGERIWPVQHAGADGKPRAVGEYALTGDELNFRWADSAQASDDALANVALAIDLDGKVVKINQRSPDAVAPLKLAVDVGAISTSAKIDAPPPSAKLYFALDQQEESFPPHQLDPAEPVAAGDHIQVIFGEATDPYRLAMRVTLVDNGVGGVRIEARPMLQAADEGKKWDLFRPKSVLQTLAQFKQQESVLDAQLEQLQQRYRRNAPQLQQATELFNRQATELQTRILTLEKMHTLCSDLNDHGALNYRVFTKLGEREIDLIDSSIGISLPVADPAAAAATEKDDASAIVGPPTAPRNGAKPAPTVPPKADDKD